MRVALDTNILAYAAGVNTPEQKHVALGLLSKLQEAETFLPVQVLGELFRVLVRKAGFSPTLARTTILRFTNTFPLIETSPAILLNGIDLAVDHGLNIWDAVILAAAAEANCRLLLSEDLQDGFNWRGVTVVNPFARKRNELLDGALEW